MRLWYSLKTVNLTRNAQESRGSLATLTSTRVQREAQEELEDPITTPFSKEMKFQGQEPIGRLTSQGRRKVSRLKDIIVIKLKVT